jgi:hypothetical protein
MHIPSPNWAFDAEDRKVYRAWLQGALAVYGAVPTVAEYLTTAVALASP